MLLCGVMCNGMDVGSGQVLWQPVPRSTGLPGAEVSLPQHTHDPLTEAEQRLEEAYSNNVAFHDFAHRIVRYRSQRHWRDVITTVMPLDRRVDHPQMQGVILNDFEQCPTPYAWGFDSTGRPFIVVAFVYGFPGNDQNDERIIIQTFALHRNGTWNSYVWHRFESQPDSRQPLTFFEAAELILDGWIKIKRTTGGAYPVKLASIDTIRRILNPHSSSMG